VLDFIEKYNTSTKDVPSDFLNQLAIDYGQACTNSLLRQFTQSAPQPGGLRVSSLGKPAVLQALSKFGYHGDGFSTPLHHVFHLGDVFEEFVIFQLRRLGYTVTDEQKEVDFMGVPGHIDLVCDGWLVEVKTMSDGYFKQFTKFPNDERGYLTQLAIYAYCTNKEPIWLCFNKGTGEMSLVRPTKFYLDQAVIRAQTIIPLLQGLTDVLETFDVFDAPPPVPEVFKKEETGKLLIPKSMAYSPYLEVFYDIEEELNGYNKPTRYVTGIKTPPESHATLTRFQRV